MNRRIATLEQALALIDKVAPTLATEEVSLDAALARVLCEEIRANRHEPASARAAMDGYALRSVDTAGASSDRPLFFEIVGNASAGRTPSCEVGRRQATVISTGAVLPPGADAVIPHEQVLPAPGGIQVSSALAAGAWTSQPGVDFQQGEHLLSKGAILQAAELTVIAALGRRAVLVRRRPRVAILATGDELAEPGSTAHPDKVFASNLQTVLQLVRIWGGEVITAAVVRDTLAAVVASIDEMRGLDLIVTTGGTGKGGKDFIAAAVTSLMGKIHFAGVRMTPGKQTLLASLGKTLLFALPGRPTAVFAALQELVRPALLRMLGLSCTRVPEVKATLCQAVENSRKEMLALLPCRLTFTVDGAQVWPLDRQAGGMFASMLASNALLRLDPGEIRGSGEQVAVQMVNLGLSALCYFTDKGQQIQQRPPCGK
ncbi:MAG: molybdopterin molybdotransferase MoeA [Deltaproteobacteria bacterium]|nr:molybdopterin molybdotransferase MoeA [Deltaproteobacteria bacterium]MBW2070197.1 molybdopterin molybdotransferase MoeA [Deltaproteobacteria bacterium]